MRSDMAHALDQTTEARSILTNATTGPATPDVLWAIGVHLAQHPWHLVAAWDGGPLIGATIRGGSLDRGRWLLAASGRITICDGFDGGPAVVTVDQSTVRRLVADTKRLPAALVAEVRALHAERTAHAVDDMTAYSRYQQGGPKESDDERDARSVRGADIEHRCMAAGAQVWDRVRPAATLFDLVSFDQRREDPT